MRNWLLPEYIEDVLPPQAWRLERARREVLDWFQRCGYQLVIPPLLEYVESLMTGTGHDLDLVTFKLVDQLSGRHMGIRADITPQAARIDAHLMDRRGVNRLCYAGSVLRTLPEGMMRTREPLQIGAELFGHAGIESDMEIQRLMLQALKIAGVGEVTVDLGHVQIFGALADAAGIDRDLESELFRAIQRKDRAAVTELTAKLDGDNGRALLKLLDLNGGFEVLDEAAAEFKHPRISQALAELRQLGQALAQDAASVSFDLAELRGYHYHSGIVFAAYAQGYADAIARGGRYDEVGRAFGRARPATGFSMDMREILANAEAETAAAPILTQRDDHAIAPIGRGGGRRAA
jgi:ATP phosphoribosyltransferase regulatory subunit